MNYSGEFVVIKDIRAQVGRCCWSGLTIPVDCPVSKQTALLEVKKCEFC